MYISIKQELAMDMISRIIEEFEDDKRWFTQAELPRITLHSIDALVFKKFLARKEVFGVVYYQRLKPMWYD